MITHAHQWNETLKATGDTPKSFLCAECGEEKPTQAQGGTGYANRANDEACICYECCGKIDRREMLDRGKACLYLTDKGLSNWPGTLRIPVMHCKQGRHNIAGKRFDVWFRIDGQEWHGTQYGENTHICHCRRIKK